MCYISVTCFCLCSSRSFIGRQKIWREGSKTDTTLLLEIVKNKNEMRGAQTVNEPMTWLRHRQKYNFFFYCYFWKIIQLCAALPKRFILNKRLVNVYARHNRIISVSLDVNSGFTLNQGLDWRNLRMETKLLCCLLKETASLKSR